MERKTNFCSSAARRKGSSPHGYQSTGLYACCCRYGLFSEMRWFGGFFCATDFSGKVVLLSVFASCSVMFGGSVRRTYQRSSAYAFCPISSRYPGENDGQGGVREDINITGKIYFLPGRITPLFKKKRLSAGEFSGPANRSANQFDAFRFSILHVFKQSL